MIKKALTTPDLHSELARLSAISAIVNSRDPLTEAEIAHAQELAKRYGWERDKDESASPGSPLAEDDLHTGDDDLLDTLTSIRAGVDDLLDADDGICEEARDTLRSILDELTKADQLRVAQLKSASPGSPWRPKLETLRAAIEKYDENDSETSYYDAKEVCNAARALFAVIDPPSGSPQDKE